MSNPDLDPEITEEPAPDVEPEPADEPDELAGAWWRNRRRTWATP